MTTKAQEITIGAAVVLVGAAVIGGVYAGKGATKEPGYDLVARFNRADGVRVGSEVRMSGLQVGRVVAQSLDQQYRAVLTLRIHPEIKVSSDTAAVIHTSGLLGEKFVSLQPGAEDDQVKPGTELLYTQDSMMVEDLLEMIIDQAKAKRAKAAQAAPNTETAPADGEGNGG